MADGGDEWRCRKHPAVGSGGVCPFCLRDRLLRLCPDCAHVRPCPCPSAASSPSSSSSTSGAAVSRVYSLIELEHRFARSRSVASSGCVERRKARVWGWPQFRKPAASGEEEEAEESVTLARSSSVSVKAVEAKGASKAGWGWLFTIPMKAFRHRKARGGGGADGRERVR